MAFRSGCESAALAMPPPVTNATATIEKSFICQLSEMIEHMRFPPARISRVELGKAIDAIVVEAHHAVVLVGDVLHGCTDLILATLGIPEQAHVTHPESSLRYHRRVRQVEPEVGHIVAIELQRH